MDPVAQGPRVPEFSHCSVKTQKPDKVERVRVVTEYLAEDNTILAYKLLSVDAGYTYEVTWHYK